MNELFSPAGWGGGGGEGEGTLKNFDSDVVSLFGFEISQLVFFFRLLK